MLDTMSINPLQVLTMVEQKVGFPYTVSAYPVVFERGGSEPAPGVELHQFGIINPRERCGSGYHAIFLLCLLRPTLSDLLFETLTITLSAMVRPR